jgi:hypothetical protein
LLCFGDIETDKMDAARAADSFAERFAESARDYDRAWQAGRRYDDLAEQVVDMRREVLDLGKEMRAARKLGLDAPSICHALRSTIVSLYRNIQKARKERAKLLDDFGTCDGFVE